MSNMSDVEMLNGSDVFDLFDAFIHAVKGDFLPMTNIIGNKMLSSIQKIPYYQLMRYLKGIKDVEDGLGEGSKLSNMLFSDSDKGKENALRIFKVVTYTDAEKKIDYLINATRAVLLRLISVEMMFRIYKAVADCIYEDLIYLSEHIERMEPIRGNINVLALARNGLMILDGFDGNLNCGEQEYSVTELGYYVDQYAISMYDEERGRWYKKRAVTGKEI